MLTLEDVERAAHRLADRIHRTPVTTCRSFDEAVGASVFFKCENLQRAGSFKIRGALNKLLTLSGEEKARGVVAFSSGNHAQGVALAARLTGTSAVIVMPTDAPASKLTATRHYGAEVVFYDRQREDREAIAREIVRQSGRVLIPPYDDDAIMAGQGTAGLELLRDVPWLDALLTPVGGGGLLSGCSTVAKALVPHARIYGVEADTANDTWLSFQKGERMRIPPPPTIADGMRHVTPGELTFPILRKKVEVIVLVSDGEISQAVRFLLFRAKLLVEPTGAVAAAALLAGKLPLRGARVGVVLSGGNVDPALLAEVIRAA
ncbi:MAG: pyridoxal-phosphate dependent enzyme [Candidatus Rokubacteria bacterium]|nr:pyridoxal-phosphate dependent enzyme [Candidatus Rokubacteria bacterium]